MNYIRSNQEGLHENSDSFEDNCLIGFEFSEAEPNILIGWS